MCLMLFGMVAGMQAQTADNTFRFVDAKGNPVADGSTINIYELTEGYFGSSSFISTGLSVENTTGAEAYVSADVTVHKLANGSFQVCFPAECVSGITSSFTTGSGAIAANDKLPLNSEWVPAGEGQYGTSTISFKLKVMTRSGKFPSYKYTYKADGPEVTVNCIYSDPTGIGNVTGDSRTVVNVYDITGKPVMLNAGIDALQSLDRGIYVYETVKDGRRTGIRKVVK